ncbi:TOM7 family-domain-containing protein [Fomitopsis serialis]|uniref:TOM7 family-domain-containing protein n=1 Tax=Fomitopsis serialis TaxID=139415 RepID=UPI002008876D|nr:TOM7 family-domain-containing protein [Neoantrodia serialis]KAH9938001.1 TOM7 family-domain-containing protein [Neoantrodia serialis]
MPSEETKERIIKAVELGRTVVHYGWIPFIIYIGYTRSNPQPSLIKYVVLLPFLPAVELTLAQVD